MPLPQTFAATTVTRPDFVNRRAAIIALVIFAALSLYCGIRSPGFIAADACTHYMAARYAFAHPLNFVDVWNRPLATALYALPAQLPGTAAVRIVCLLVALGCGVVSYWIAAGQGLRWPALAILFTLGQPLLFLHSFGEMTELPFALVFGVAFLAWQKERFFLAAALIAWTPLARPEGFGFVFLAAVGLLLYRKWLAVFLLPIPLVIWDLAGWQISHHAHPWYRWLIDSWPYSGQSVYGRGYLLTFVALLPAVISPIVLPAMWVGMGRSLLLLREGRGAGFGATEDTGGPPVPQSEPLPRNSRTPRLQGCIVLTAALPLFVLVVHSLLYWLGKMASFGEPRYLLVVAPLWGVLSARGWTWFFDRFRWRHPLGWAAAAVFVPVGINLAHPVVPIPLSHDWQSALELAEWIKTNEPARAKGGVIAAHPGIFYFLNVNPHDSPDMTVHSLRTAPQGTLLIWDPIFSETNASADDTLTLAAIRKAGWTEIAAPNPYEANPDAARPVVRDPNDPRSHWHVFVRR